MSIRLDTLGANDSLANLQTTLTQTEQLGFQLITLAKGMLNSKPANFATFLRLAPGTAPGPLTLALEPGSNPLAQQQTDLNQGGSGGRRLISYAAVLVQGQEANVAAYRG